MVDSWDDVYFDAQGGVCAEHMAEIIAKIAAGFLLAYFSMHELVDELTEYRTLRRLKRGITYDGG